MQSEYANSTIATKLNIVRIFYKAAQNHELIENNPALKIKAPSDRKDPAARITFMEAEELKYLLDYIQSQLDEAQTNKDKLSLLRDRLLIGIMSLEGCRTVEMHQLKVADIVRQGIKTGLQVSAKRASRIVPLTKNLAAQLDEYFQMRRKVLRRKIKPTDYVFVSSSNNNKGGQLSRRSIREICDRALIECNLKFLNPNSKNGLAISKVNIDSPNPVNNVAEVKSCVVCISVVVEFSVLFCVVSTICFLDEELSSGATVLELAFGSITVLVSVVNGI